MRVAVVLCVLAAVPASADTEAIQKVVKPRMGEFRFCAQREMHPNKAGKIVLAVALDKTGGVTSAKVETSTVNHKRIEDCVVRSMKALRFPSEAPRKFHYPFFFEGAS